MDRPGYISRANNPAVCERGACGRAPKSPVQAPTKSDPFAACLYVAYR